MRSIKRASILLAAALSLLIALPTGASAANGRCGEHVTWTLSNDVLTIEGSGAMYNWKSSGNAGEVAPWYDSRSSITGVVIKTGVTTVGDNAFYGCESLASVTLPSTTLTSIGSYAFYGCKGLTDIKLPASLKTIGSYAFYDADGLRMVTIPGGVSTLPGSLFKWSGGLHDVAIPKSVTKIEDYAFDTGNLCDVHYEGTQAEWNKITVGSNGNGALKNARKHFEASVDYVKFVPGKTCGRGVTYTLSNGKLTVGGSGWMWNYDDSGYDYDVAPWNAQKTSITSVVLGGGVKCVGDYVFKNCSNLASVSLPEGLEEIGASAFENCDCKDLINIRLPSTLQKLGRGAFYNTDYIRMFTIPSGVTELPGSLFKWSGGLHDVAIPKSVTSIGNYAFDVSNLCDVHYEGTQAEWDAITVGSDGNGALKNARVHCGASIAYKEFVPGVTCGRGVTYSLQNGVLTVGGSGWMWNYDDGGYDYDVAPWNTQKASITSVVLGGGVKCVGDYAFKNCHSLASVSLPEGLEEIGASAFENCDCKDLINIRLPSTLRRLGRGAFYNTDYIRMFTIPNGVTELPGSLFKWSGGLHDVAIPKSVTSIGNYAFDISNLCDVHYEGTQAEWDAITVGSDGNGALKNARVHCGASIAYKEFVPGVTCGRGVTYSLQNGTLTVSGSGWMWNWNNGGYEYEAAPWYGQREAITNVVMRDGVKCIGRNAFYYYTSLTDLTLPRSVSVIEKDAFYSCKNLTDVWYAGTEAERYELLTIVERGNERLDREDCVWHYLGLETPPFRVEELKVLNASGKAQTSVPTGQCFVRLKITRIEQRKTAATVILAAYDKNGKLLDGLLFFEVDADLGASATVTLPVDNSAGQIKTFKAFVVKSLTNLTPLCEATVFPE